MSAPSKISVSSRSTGVSATVAATSELRPSPPSPIGGILGAGSNIAAGYLRSDRDVKKNIHRIGTVFAALPEGADKKLPIYQYAYKDDPASTKHIGPMAQDVEKIDPGAVRSIGGVKHIQPERVMGNILRAA
jgi:hypothetical protein